jgi:hypothetical protein
MRALFAKMHQLLNGPAADSHRCTIELISVHIPKTAGTAFRNVLEQNYARDTLLLDYGDRVLDMASLFQADFEKWKKDSLRRVTEIELRVRCVHGHFWVGKYAELFPSARKIAWLRDPVQRLVSHYFFWKNLPRSDHSLHQRMLDEQMTLLEFAALPAMRNIVTNTFLRGYSFHDLDFVGLQEFFGEDLGHLHKMMDWPIQSIPVENRNATREYATFQPDSRALREIAALNEADLEFYNTVLSQRKVRHVT